MEPHIVTVLRVPCTGWCSTCCRYGDAAEKACSGQVVGRGHDRLGRARQLWVQQLLCCTMASDARMRWLTRVAHEQVPADDKALWAAQDAVAEALPSALSRVFCGVQEQFFETSKVPPLPCFTPFGWPAVRGRSGFCDTQGCVQHEVYMLCCVRSAGMCGLIVRKQR